MKRTLCLLLTAAAVLCGLAQERKVTIHLLETTDVHGNYLPYDFLQNTRGRGSLARVLTYVDRLRHAEGDSSVVLLDNGDILQGQPTAYYYNFIDTLSQHLCADVLNYMRYDALTVGNHDIETGHAVYDRWAGECHAPMLGANVVDEFTGITYWKPYTVIRRQGVRIAVLGMTTPGIPMWLPRTLWSGLRFDDLVETARSYMPQMQREADVVVALVHSGVGPDEGAQQLAENAAVTVACQVPGFDVVFCGHDHRRALRTVRDKKGREVWVLNPAAGAESLARATLTLTLNKEGKVTGRDIEARIVDIDSLSPDSAMVAHFARQARAVRTFTSQIIGQSDEEMQTTPAFFGPSAFIDFIHRMQLEISGADISFAAPLAFDAVIHKGKIRVSDMFNLYRYENMLYVMTLTGREVKDYLEYAYDHWIEQMGSADSPFLQMRPGADTIPDAWARLKHPSYNFDSAAGIRYTVDVRMSRGRRVHIESMADGSPFSPDSTYRCAINSYRGNGGGGLLTEGAGIPADELQRRIVWSTDKDLRYYLIRRIGELRHISPRPLDTWRFVPEEWVEQARRREEPLLR